MSKRFKIVLATFLITGSLYFIITGLTSGKKFLIPLVTGIILAMVMNPVSEKLKSWGIGKGLAILISDLVVVAFIALMIFLFTAQANKVAGNWSQIEDRMQPKVEKVKNFMDEKLNIRTFSSQTSSDNSQSSSSQGNTSQDNQRNGQQEKASAQTDQGQSAATAGQQKNKPQKQSILSSSTIRSKLTALAKSLISIISNLLLILVYIFFFMFYKEKFENTIIGFVNENRREQTREILVKVSKTAQKYLFGRFILILILALLYFAGFSILGLKYALFISITAALFSLVPYIGNFVGLSLAIAMAVMFGGSGFGKIIAIVAVFMVIQFIESYILEPYIVGKKVDVNPVMIIVGVVLGGIIWGVMGMILSIPILGILKVIFDNTKSLKPLGYAFDERDISSGGGKMDKVKEWITEKVKKIGN